MSFIDENTITLVSTTTGIDATATGVTTLFNAPVSKTFIPDHIVIRVTSFTSGGKAVQAIASFGGNSATFDDYLNSITYTVSTNNTFIRDSVEDTAVTVQAALDVFSINVETASDATTEIWAVEAFGYLV